ncbi:MAG: hypothetical protein HQL96_11305 [Magnetococcales bacterium]|nr:hypothetical protein [Magnetococcales bacterium]
MEMNIIRKFGFGLCAVMLAACGTTGTMQIEVDVYKGPLSKTKDAHWEELHAIAVQAKASVGELHYNTQRLLGCVYGKNEALSADKPSKFALADLATLISVCRLVADMKDAANDINKIFDQQATIDAQAVSARIAEHNRMQRVLNEQYVALLPSALIAAGTGCDDKNKAPVQKLDEWLKEQKQNLYKLQLPNHVALGKSPDTLHVVGSSLDDWKSQLDLLKDNNPCINKDNLSKLQNLKESVKIMTDHFLEMRDMAFNLRLNELAKVSHNATRMKLIAGNLVHIMIPYVSNDDALRKTHVASINAAGEYGNLLEARTKSLMARLKGVGRKHMQTSHYLDGSEASIFPDFYTWYEVIQPGIYDTGRVKAYERVFSDHHWARLNTVYASGQGKTQMAFIRDETGNWDLKSFSSDPTELLAAYKNATIAGINTAATLMTGAKKIGDLQTLMAGASKLLQEPEEKSRIVLVTEAHKDTSASFGKMKTSLEEKMKTIDGTLDKVNPTQADQDRVEVEKKEALKKTLNDSMSEIDRRLGELAKY